ncbi:MAG: hypothetical protein OEM24_06935, partial [Paracoccaceae bacterium]|nr:hypothetical protein [Paracoccaceae bacterium]
YAHYLEATANQRRDLRDILAWFDGGSDLAAVPFDVLSRTYAAESFLGAEPGFDAVEQLPGLAEADEAARKKGVGEMLARRATAMLSNIADVVAKYEDGFDGSLSRIAAMRKYVNEGNEYDFLPAHVALMPVESFAPPEGGYGEVRDHLFPEGGWVYPGLAETRMEDALLTARNILAGGFAAEGSLGAAVREWEERYKTARAEARDELGAVLDGFRTTLAQDLGYWDLQIDVEDQNPFAGIFEDYAGDLAERHPLWKRLLRQRFQMVKIDLAAEQGARVTEAEATAVAQNLKRDAPEVALDWQGKGAADLTAIRGLFAEDAARVLRRSENLFDLELKVEAEGPLVVSNLARGAVTAKPFAGPEEPVITEAEVKEWSERNYWELVRDPDFEGAIQPQPAAAPTEEDGEAVLQEATATTEICEANRPDRDWEAAVWFLPEPTATPNAIAWPLTTPGAFKARITITGWGGVPLARVTVPLEVAPAELSGELKLDGGPIEPDLGESLLGYVDGPMSERPDFPLFREGPFRTQLCGALSQYLMDETAEAPGLKDPATAAEAMEVYGLFLPVPNAPASEITRGGPAAVEHVALGQFALKDPLEIELPRIRDVAVWVKATDVLGTELAGAESTILYREARLDGPGPRELVLQDGDVLGAEARLETPAGVAEGRAEEHEFDRAADLGGVELGVELPAYAERSFAASGQFVLQGPDQAEVGGIDGGTVWSNILARVPEPISGAAFEIENLDVVLLANGLSLDALLRGTDEIQSLLVPQTVRLSPLPRSGALDLGEIPVRRYTTSPVEMRATVSDWAGRRIDAPDAEVTLSDAPLAFAEGVFRGQLSFRGYAERLEVKAAVDLPDGSKAERLAELRLAAIGDPLNPSPPAPVELKVPVYLPGSLQVVGSFALEGAADDAQGTLEVEVSIADTGGGDPWTALPGERFAFDLSFPVKPGMRIVVRAKGEVGGTTYEGEARGLVPIEATGLPTLLDLGSITLRETGGMLAVPNLIGRDADEAVAEFGARFTINVLRPTSAENPAEAGQIFTQTPPPHEPGAPSRLPAGGVITAGAYRKAETLVLPDMRGQVGTEAQAELLAMGVIATLSDGAAAGPGEEPGRVASHAPPGGTEIDPARQQVVLSVLTEAPPEPEPELEPEPEPEPEPETPPLPPPPPAEEIVGGYLGTIRLARVEIVSNEPDVRFSLDCTSFESCAPRWVDTFASSARRAIEEIERERQREEREERGLESLPAIPGEVIGEVLDEIGVAIALAIGQAGVIVMDVLFQGLDIGLVVEKAADGTMFVRLPGAEPAIQQVLDRAVLTADEAGAVTFVVSGYRLPNMTAPLDVEGRLVPQDERVALELRISVREPGTGSRGALSFVGDLAAGEVTPRPLLGERAAQIAAEMENPSGRIATVSRPLIDLQARLEEE